VFTTWFSRSARMDDDTGTPVGINIAVGAGIITVALLAASTVPAVDPQWRCAVVAAALGLFAASTVDWVAVSAVVLPTWMVMNGFLVNQLGDLSWHGWADLDRFLALVAAGCLGLAVGTARRGLLHLREQGQLGAAVQNMRTEFNKETRRA